MSASEQSRHEREPIAKLLAELDANGAKVFHYQANQVVFESEQPAHEIFHLQVGQVRVFQCSSGHAGRLLEIVGPGAWMGVAALSAEPTFGMSARTFSPSTIRRIPRSLFLDVMTKTPEFAAALVEQLASRLVGSYISATRLMQQSCDNRVLETLLDLSRSPAALVEDDAVVLEITHQELAQAVGVARETISVAIAALRQQDLVTTARNRLMFHPRALREFADAQNQIAEKKPWGSIDSSFKLNAEQRHDR